MDLEVDFLLALRGGGLIIFLYMQKGGCNFCLSCCPNFPALPTSIKWLLPYIQGKLSCKLVHTCKY